jgi:hypothetical protein
MCRSRELGRCVTRVRDELVAQHMPAVAMLFLCCAKKGHVWCQAADNGTMSGKSEGVHPTKSFVIKERRLRISAFKDWPTGHSR